MREGRLVPCGMIPEAWFTRSGLRVHEWCRKDETREISRPWLVGRAKGRARSGWFAQAFDLGRPEPGSVWQAQRLAGWQAGCAGDLVTVRVGRGG